MPKKFLLLLIVFTAVFRLSAQGSGHLLEITGIEVIDGNRHLLVKVKALENNRATLLRGDEIEFYETIKNNPEKKVEIVGRIRSEVVYKELDVSEASFLVLFLIDISNQTSENHLKKAKEAISKLVKDYSLKDNIKFTLKTFSEEVSESIPLNGNNVTSVLNNLGIKDKNPDLFYALSNEADILNRHPGKKIIFLFSNGINNTEGNLRYSQGRSPVKAEAALATLDNLDEEFFIFPIALGTNSNDSFLKAIPEKTSTTEDDFQKEVLPPNIDRILKNNQVIESTHIIQISTQKEDFIGIKRTYKLKGIGNRTEQESIVTIGEGTLEVPKFIKTPKPLGSWVLDFLIGLVILTMLLGGFSLVVPVFKKEQFKKKFVKPYIPEPKVRKKDPLTLEEIQEGELVVINKCKQITPLQTWIDMGWQCPNYPDCINGMSHLQCNGGGKPENDYNFFGMQGIYRKLNWLWFGMVGGFLGWTLFVLFKIFDFLAYDNLLKGLYGAYARMGFSGNPPNFRDLSSNTISGIGFGMFVVFMLSWVEERSQSRKISWLRILSRTLLGTLAAFIIFSIGFYFQYKGIISNIYVNWFITWLFFGLVVGFILSIKSSISLKRGLIGGALSGALAFCIYIGFSKISSDFGLSKLFSLLVMGGMLGFILDTVFTSMEDFELEIITPKAYSRIIPISKWLKTGMEVFIGTAQGAYVYIKWPDPVAADEHAELSFDNKHVYIKPKTETMIGKRIIPMNEKTALKNGDVIQLGRNSITQFRYKEKRTASLIGKS